MNMIKVSVLLMGATLFFGASAPAKAELYSINFQGSIFNLSAEVSTDNTNTITSIVSGGTISSANIGSAALSLNTTGLDSLFNSFSFDNMIFSVPPSPSYVDSNGLLFNAGGFTYNLFYTGTGIYPYAIVTFDGPDATNFDVSSTGDAAISFSVEDLGPSQVSAVPEPSSWLMLILGFAGTALLGYRRRRKAALEILPQT